MQEFYLFAIAVVAISASGVLAPGPLFAATVSRGSREGLSAGLRISYGHTLVEFPLVLLIGIGTISLEDLPQFRIIVTMVGAVSIFAFAVMQVRSALKSPHNTGKARYGSFLTGVFLTGFNPFFLVWWFTIGLKLISDAYTMWSFWGIFIMFGLHIWMDYAWLCLVSSVSARGSRLLSSRVYKLFIVGINVFLVYFGIVFLLDSLSAVNGF